MLFNEPKLLKCWIVVENVIGMRVSVLFNEPKLLKSLPLPHCLSLIAGFSALQRAEIAEIRAACYRRLALARFSALQRAEIAEIKCDVVRQAIASGFSALQRAEIAEIVVVNMYALNFSVVSVLFNEPKLLK